ncbi:MAG: hypothetical protein ABSG19_00185 [Candidatus Aminicenantales bacterium]
MNSFVCIVTGPIVGLQSTWFLDETVRFAATLNRKIKVFNVLDEVIEATGAEAANAYEKAAMVGELLDGYQYQFDCMREKAYQAIARKIDRLPRTVSAVVRIPASIEWRGVNLEFKDHRVIAETLCPDRIVTLIDAENKIFDRLRTDYGQHVLRVIAQRSELNLSVILRWLGSEVSRSEDWAEWCSHITGKRVRHYVLGIMAPGFPDRTVLRRDVENMTKAVTERNLPSFYASYSMTVAGPTERKEINNAIWGLRKYGLVIDPGSIEIGNHLEGQDEGVVFAYTVCRDLRWDVRKVDVVAAFHPYRSRPPLSTGMMDEIGHARAFRKERYLVLPTGGGSPFTGGNYVPKNHLFTDTDSFFGFIEKKRRPPLKPVFADTVAAFVKWTSKGRG